MIDALLRVAGRLREQSRESTINHGIWVGRSCDYRLERGLKGWPCEGSHDVTEVRL